MTVLLFVNFYSELPDTFINFLYSKYPDCCNLTIHDKLDFNRWNIAFRESSKVNHAIKLYEKQHGSLSSYFKFELNKGTGFITLNTNTNEEFWETNKKV